MKNFTTLIGWLLLAAILAVPSFLYYNWWSNKKRDEARLVSVQSVSAVTIFSSAPAASATLPQSFSQPHPPKADAQAAQPPAAPRPAPMPPAPAAGNAPQSDAPVSAPQVSTAAAAGAARSTAAVQAGMAADAQAPVSTQALTSYFEPKSDRDPTVSPAEYRKIRENEALRREEERQRRLLLNRQQRETGCESRMALQGIVGNSVIINGEIYSVGNTVYGAKILKIGSNYVIGECKGRRFRKVLQ